MATYDLTTDTITTLVKDDILNCPYSGSSVSVTLPKGTFQLECWGAQGGTYSSYYGGAGGYSIGTLTLSEPTEMFLEVGGQPATNSTSQSMSNGGYNGGGKGAVRHYSSTYSYGQGGGGGTDIRIAQNNLYSRVIVAGGGGGSSSVNALTTKYGGGTSGGSPTSGYGATQTTGGSAGTKGTFGVGADTLSSKLNYKYGSGGGGGGWYGGAAANVSDDNTTAYRGYNGGGSGYVYTSATAANYPSGCTLNESYYLEDASTAAGNTSFTSPSGTSETGHSGNGYARITVLDIPKEDEGGGAKQKPLNFKVYADGKWVDAYAGYAKVNGSWKKLKSAYAYKDGAWKGSFENLESAPWSYISALSSSGTAANVWSVGDTKSIKLSGTVGTLSLDTTLLVYILGFDHNTENGESSGITFGGFKTSSTTGIDVCLIDSSYNSTKSDGTKAFNMNHWGGSSSPYNTNYGGWKGSDMRYDILGSTNVAPSGYGSTATTSRVGYDPSSYDIINAPVSDTLLAAFPEDVRAVMKPNTIYTDNTGNSSNTSANVTTSVEYLWLPSEFEIFGTRTYANTYEQSKQAQYQYYADGRDKIKYNHSATGTAIYYWTRSPRFDSVYHFVGVRNTGLLPDGLGSYYSRGLSPAFLV